MLEIWDYSLVWKCLRWESYAAVTLLNVKSYRKYDINLNHLMYEKVIALVSHHEVKCGSSEMEWQGVCGCSETVIQEFEICCKITFSSLTKSGKNVMHQTRATRNLFCVLESICERTSIPPHKHISFPWILHKVDKSIAISFKSMYVIVLLFYYMNFMLCYCYLHNSYCIHSEFIIFFLLNETNWREWFQDVIFPIYK